MRCDGTRLRSHWSGPCSHQAITGSTPRHAAVFCCVRRACVSPASCRLASGPNLALGALPRLQGTTQPPPRLTERDLIAKMEEYGIGTDATVADHIQKQVGASVPALQGSTSGCTTKALEDSASGWMGAVFANLRVYSPAHARWRRTVQPELCISLQLERGYAVKDEGTMQFSPTPLGEALISAYRKMG